MPSTSPAACLISNPCLSYRVSSISNNNPCHTFISVISVGIYPGHVTKIKCLRPFGASAQTSPWCTKNHCNEVCKCENRCINKQNPVADVAHKESSENRRQNLTEHLPQCNTVRCIHSIPDPCIFDDHRQRIYAYRRPGHTDQSKDEYTLAH